MLHLIGKGLARTRLSISLLSSVSTSIRLAPVLTAIPTIRYKSSLNKPNLNLNTNKSTKRRQAAASQFLRENPPSTRGPVLECVSYTTADRYDLPLLSVILKSQGIVFSSVPTDDDTALVVSLSEKPGYSQLLPPENWLGPYDTRQGGQQPFGLGQAGEIWIFANGSYVTWGVAELVGKAFLRHVVRSRMGGRVETGAYDKVHTEDVDFVVDPTEETVIKGNLIILGRPPTLTSHAPAYASLLTRYTLSLALSRSSALSAMEDKLDAHLESVARLPRDLARYGKQPLKRKEVIKKIGELLMLRDAVNFRGGGLEDTPEIYWSEPDLEGYFDSVSTEFELKERIDAVNQKVDYAHEVQSTLRALLTEASGHRMEMIIIALIAVEVAIVLTREGRELYETLIGFFKEHEVEKIIEDIVAEPEPIELEPKRLL